MTPTAHVDAGADEPIVGLAGGAAADLDELCRPRSRSAAAREMIAVALEAERRA